MTAEVTSATRRGRQRTIFCTRIKQEREAVMRGDELATERQHAKGKLTARERLEGLLDEGSFVELDLFRRGDGTARTDGVVTGAGTVYGRRVFVYAQDFRYPRRLPG